jgi:hypothetical protein
MKRDFILNRHWTPRGAALAWVMRRGAAVARLRLLGDGGPPRAGALAGDPRPTALFLYFIHQIIAYTLGAELAGVALQRLAGFWLANAVFIVILPGARWGWLSLSSGG